MACAAKSAGSQQDRFSTLIAATASYAGTEWSYDDALQRNTTSAGFLTQLAQLQARGSIPARVDLGDITFDGNLTVTPPCTTVSACPTPAQVQALRDTATLGEGRILSPTGYDNPWSVQVSGGKLEASADVFNVFNANNQSGFANAATTSNQIQFGGGADFVQRNAGAPRQVQFGLAYKF